MTITKAQFASDASWQLAYILGALGHPDNHDATLALRTTLESRGSPKVAAEVIAEVLREIKNAIRKNVEASKDDGREIEALKGKLRAVVADRGEWQQVENEPRAFDAHRQDDSTSLED